LLSEWGCEFLQGALIGLASDQRPWADKKDRSAIA
jgi:hypothetical protein